MMDTGAMLAGAQLGIRQKVYHRNTRAALTALQANGKTMIDTEAMLAGAQLGIVCQSRDAP